MSSPLRLIHITGQLGYGGAERLILDLTRKIDKEKFAVSVIAVKGNGALESQFAAAGIPVTVIAKKFRGEFGVIGRIEKYLRQEKPDVVHTHLFLGDFFGGMAARRAGVPVIISTKHDVMSEGWLRDRITRYMHRQATRVIAISEATREFILRKERVSVEKVALIYNGIDAAKFFVASPKLFSQEVVTFGVVGRLSHEKGHHYLLRACRFLTKRPWRLVIVGDGPEREPLERLASELGIEDNVQFVGAVDNVRPYLEKMDVFVLPSLTEGLSLAVIEAAMAGKFVIATNVGGVPEIVTDHQSGLLFRPKRIEQLVAHMDWVFDHRHEASAMAHKLQTTAVARFDINMIIKQYEQLYQDCLRNL